jgi:hypothetical protein
MRRYSVRLLFVLIFLGLASACSSGTVQPTSGYVDLSNLQPLPTPAKRETTPLRVAVAAVISPQGTIDSYGSILSYLGD